MPLLILVVVWIGGNLKIFNMDFLILGMLIYVVVIPLGELIDSKERSGRAFWTKVVAVLFLTAYLIRHIIRMLN